MIIDTKYEIGQKVKITGLGGFPGIIVGFEQDMGNLWYKVQYWAEWHIVTVQLNESEFTIEP